MLMELVYEYVHLWALVSAVMEHLVLLQEISLNGKFDLNKRDYGNVMWFVLHLDCVH
jgi:hypothetical protein